MTVKSKLNFDATEALLGLGDTDLNTIPVEVLEQKQEPSQVKQDTIVIYRNRPTQTKSKHVQLLFQPELLKAVDNACKKIKVNGKALSRNAYIEMVLKKELGIEDKE